MRKCAAFCLLNCCFFLAAQANHITGGEMSYVYLGFSNNTYQYRVTLKLFKRCESERQLNNPAIISVFDKITHARLMDLTVPLGNVQTLNLTNPDRCITNPPRVCFNVGYYEFVVSLPASANGYILSGQFIYRVAGLANVASVGNIGATYTAEIPGTLPENGIQKGSARFVGSDLVVICAGNSFSYSFAATDEDGDQLRYSFCQAYQGGTQSNNNVPSSPPYESVPYSSGYSGSTPLGSHVQIDGSTGLITGIAPEAPGIYVVSVCVQEIRDGVVIATQRKDIQISITPCTIVGATLKPEYMLCSDTKTITLSNLSVSSLITSQYWEFTNANGQSLYSSPEKTVSYSFVDTGVYQLKLVVNRGGECSDSTVSQIRVYPGFVPDFTSDGICISKPTRFRDRSTTAYGTVNYWSWDFGESINPANFSSATNPAYTYASTGNKSIRLITGNSVGCLDTIDKVIEIVDKPPVGLAFRDTIICVNDRLQLSASGQGQFSWTPGLSITGANTASPVVSPSSTTVYYVDIDDNGCLNRDSVSVRVTDHVNLTAMSDTSICEGDSIFLRIESDGLKYSWSPATQVIDASAARPLAVTQANTVYEVTASIGGCVAREQVQVSTVPYPVADAGPDTTICYNTLAEFHASTDGSSFNWSPGEQLTDSRSLRPSARLQATTSFVFSAFDTRGCPKAGTDIVMVTVLPPIEAYAGGDTAVVVDQPLQLQATGGSRYSWSPATALSATDIADPLAVYHAPANDLEYKVLVYNEAQCVDSAYVHVKVFESRPEIFVPSAFTPDGNGKNDLLRPISAGIREIQYFNVYNRWGQLVFTMGSGGKGWDGTVAGRPQDSGVFVWMVKAVDYKGSAYFKKGMATLLR